ncbi:MAG: DUF2000 domain-containing protein [Akkermansiaceae bacterium]|nr:DUF2000 domain-containing protein [Armatimonadota bacterium]
MNSERKCVIAVAGDLPVGLILNAVAVLSVAIGHRVENITGGDVRDASGQIHVGIVNIPIPILKATASEVKAIRAQALSAADLLVVGMTETAQSARVYEEYAVQMSETMEEYLVYRAVALCGDKKAINKLTGSLSLYR